MSESNGSNYRREELRRLEEVAQSVDIGPVGAHQFVPTAVLLETLQPCLRRLIARDVDFVDRLTPRLEEHVIGVALSLVGGLAPWPDEGIGLTWGTLRCLDRSRHRGDDRWLLDDLRRRCRRFWHVGGNRQ